jgi:hypothetical protein
MFYGPERYLHKHVLDRVPLNHPTSSLHQLKCTLLVDRSSTFKPLCGVQSNKASIEITRPYDGTVTEILVQEGQVAKVGRDLCMIEVDNEASNLSDVPTSEALIWSTMIQAPSIVRHRPRNRSMTHLTHTSLGCSRHRTSTL